MSVPKLRFPEFCDSGEWDIKEFSKYIVLYRGSSPRPIQNYLSSDSSGVNWIKIGDTKSAKNFVISQVEKKITPDGAKKSRRVNVGELILANSMSYGKTYQVAIDGYIYDGWFVLRDYEKYFDKQFLLQLLNSEYMQNQYERFSAGGIVQNISSDIVYKTVLPHTSLKEQQKIADCLSSISDRITAETQKLDTLKAHKKGLMQQLFPAEGETLPKLRFPEFHDSGEWVKQKVSNILVKVSNPVTVDPNETYYQIGIRSHGKGIFHKESINGDALGSKRVFWIEDNAFIVNIVFAWELAVANTTVTEKGMIASHRFPMYKAYKNRANVVFIKYFFLTNKGKELLWIASPGGAGRNKTLGQKEFENLDLLIPKLVEEQQRIADCLTSIDEAIAAQSQAIDLLKLHKKGLMQQLFPSVEEVQG